MGSSLVHVIAVTLIAVLAGLPVIGVLCARECTAVSSAATSADAAEHCHEPATPGTSIAAATSDGCERPLEVVLATRDRSTPSVGDSLATAPPVQVDQQPPYLHAFASFQRQPGNTQGFPPVTRVPLRI